MTEYEAIELLFQNAYDKEFTSESIEAFGMAIQALKKIQQYRAIGTVQEFKTLKEKTESKKVIEENYEKLGSTSVELDKLLGRIPDYEKYPVCGYDRSWCG